MDDDDSLDKRRRKRVNINLRTPKTDCEGPTIYRTPIILTKPEKEKVVENAEINASPPKNLDRLSSQPTIILKAKDNEVRSVSPSHISGISTRKETDSTPQYHLAAKSSSLSSNCEGLLSMLPVQGMKNSVKLIDDTLTICDSITEFLQDQTEYLVVGCFGLQGSGKSTILSHLVSSDYNKKTFPFKAPTESMMNNGEHCTEGVDIYITSERVIILDSQPVLSPSVMDRLAQADKKLSADFGSTENTLEVHSLQLAAFLMSVCHVVLLVQDWVLDPSIIRFVLTADMLRPLTSTSSLEEYIEHTPHFLMVHNRCHTDYFLPQRIGTLQYLYSQALDQARLQLYTNLSIKVSSAPCDASDSEGPNLFLLPDRNDEGSSVYMGHPSFEEGISKLRQLLWNVQRSNISPNQLSEKSWFHYAAKMWDIIKKSTFFLEYSRLLP